MYIRPNLTYILQYCTCHWLIVGFSEKLHVWDVFLVVVAFGSAILAPPPFSGTAIKSNILPPLEQVLSMSSYAIQLQQKSTISIVEFYNVFSMSFPNVCCNLFLFNFQSKYLVPYFKEIIVKLSVKLLKLLYYF